MPSTKALDSVVEEVWLLPGAHGSASSFIDAVRQTRLHAQKLCHQMPDSDDEGRVRQLWWEGQWVGAAATVATPRPEEGLGELSALARIGELAGPGMIAHLLRTDEQGRQLVHLDAHEGFDPRQPVATFPRCSPLGLSVSQARSHLVSSRVLDAHLFSSQPFEALAMQVDLTEFSRALARMDWREEEALASWWRCSENWLNRSSVLCVPGNALGFHTEDLPSLASPEAFEVAHQVKVLELLAKALPVDLLDAGRATDMMLSVLRPTGFWSRSSMEMASLHWLRALIGPDEAWSACGMGVAFDNAPVPFQLEWFAQLSPAFQHRALDEAHAERHRRLAKLNIAAENMGVSSGVPELFEACPDWRGWPDALSSIGTSKRGAPVVQRLVEGMERHALAQRLEDTLGPAPSKPRSRM